MPSHTVRDLVSQVRQLRGGRRTGAMQAQLALWLFDVLVYAVEPQHVKVDIEVERAAERFSGLARQSDVNAKSRVLVAATNTRRLSAIGNMSLAQYSPPWTPWFMRRNEVMIRVAPTP